MEFNINNLISNDKNTLDNTKNKPKAGRPKSDTVRNKKIMAYFSQDEYNALLQHANQNDISLSKLLRKLAMQFLNKK